jgi:hypothetical protein
MGDQFYLRVVMNGHDLVYRLPMTCWPEVRKIIDYVYKNSLSLNIPPQPDPVVDEPDKQDAQGD